jgi:hypothetical protein
LRQNLNALEMSGAFGVPRQTRCSATCCCLLTRSSRSPRPALAGAEPDSRRPGPGHKGPPRTHKGVLPGHTRAPGGHTRTLFSLRKAVVMGTPATARPPRNAPPSGCPGVGSVIATRADDGMMLLPQPQPPARTPQPVGPTRSPLHQT